MTNKQTNKQTNTHKQARKPAHRRATGDQGLSHAKERDQLLAKSTTIGVGLKEKAANVRRLIIGTTETTSTTFNNTDYNTDYNLHYLTLHYQHQQSERSLHAEPVHELSARLPCLGTLAPSQPTLGSLIFCASRAWPTPSCSHSHVVCALTQ
jgi:hypothetical protein